MLFENVLTSFGGEVTEDDWKNIREYEEKKPIGFYHCMKFPNSLQWKGYYDIENTFPLNHLPASYSGKSVLEIGPMDGFFTYLAEKGGAE